ncbi:MAG: hypothetical protein WBX81_03325 [Nitrososphaeraceae archaeon]
MVLHSASSGDGGGNKGDFIVGSYADGYELGKEHGKNDDRNNSGFDATCPDGSGLSYCAGYKIGYGISYGASNILGGN